MSKPVFADLGLSQPLLAAVGAAGYDHPTPIQAAAIPVALAGRDLVATAQTGTGKTAAFALPLLQRLAASQADRPEADSPPPARSRRRRGFRRPAAQVAERPVAVASAGRPRALILTPTRELAQQIDESLQTYGQTLRLRTSVILGGVPQESQVRALQRGVDILVATPGRLIDLIEQGHVACDQVEIFVLDEADRMLDMGFIHAVRQVAGLLPTQRQTLLFSATMSPPIVRLAAALLRDPQTISVSPPASVSGQIDQRVMFVNKADKRALLADILKSREVTRALVFARTKHGAERLAKLLGKAGVDADAIHSNKTQGARQRVLAAFSKGQLKVLVATDIVARGIDVDGISHVINYELPAEPESYVHRIGRTARAEAHGIAMAFCDVEELSLLRGIERLTNQPLTIVSDHRYHADNVADCFTQQRQPQRVVSPRRAYRSYGTGRGRRAAMR
jgi:ATP-dependent RNA helicase RhlE